MAEHRVTRTAKEDRWLGGQHRHIAALCLESGRRISKEHAITDIKLRRETYYTREAGQVAIVQVVDRCAMCTESYLRTSADTTTKNNLLELPDC